MAAATAARSVRRPRANEESRFFSALCSQASRWSGSVPDHLLEVADQRGCFGQSRHAILDLGDGERFVLCQAIPA